MVDKAKLKVMPEPEIRAALDREERAAARLFTHTRETTRLLQDGTIQQIKIIREAIK